MNRPLSLVLGLAAAAALLAGCATAPGISPSPSPTDGPPDASTGGLAAAWLDGGTTVGVVTWGSSTCAPTLTGSAVDGQTLTVDLQGVPHGTACTFDYVAQAYPVPVPGVDPAQDLRVVMNGPSPDETVLAGAADLPPAAEGQPSAGWTGLPGLLVLLTWGSSSCPPRIAEASLTDPGQITVVEATPPADQVCTADFAPRVTAVDVQGVKPGFTYMLTFVSAGPETAPVLLPIGGVVGN